MWLVAGHLLAGEWCSMLATIVKCLFYYGLRQTLDKITPLYRATNCLGNCRISIGKQLPNKMAFSVTDNVWEV